MKTYNLGTGQGVSVLDLVRGVEDACGIVFFYPLHFILLFYLISHETKTNQKKKKIKKIKNRKKSGL